MAIFKKIEIEKERELKDLIKHSPGSVEQGLRVLIDEFPVESGAIDLLCVDSGNVLTIVELKIHEDDSMLMQAIRYYDAVSQNIYRIAKMYPKVKIDEKEEPRIILIAPGFSGILKKCAKYLDIKLDLVEYASLEVNNEKGLICRSIDIETPKEIPIQRSVEDHLNYITDDKVRQLSKEVIGRIKDAGEDIEVYARKFYIGFKYKERLFARIKTKRTFFYTMVTLAPEWEIDKTKIEEPKDFTEEHFNRIKEAYQEVGGKLKES